MKDAAQELGGRAHEWEMGIQREYQVIWELWCSRDMSSRKPLDLRSNGSGQRSCKFAIKTSTNILFMHNSSSQAVTLRSQIQQLPRARITKAPKLLYHLIFSLPPGPCSWILTATWTCGTMLLNSKWIFATSGFPNYYVHKIFPPGYSGVFPLAYSDVPAKFDKYNSSLLKI